MPSLGGRFLGMFLSLKLPSLQAFKETYEDRGFKRGWYSKMERDREKLTGRERERERERESVCV